MNTYPKYVMDIQAHLRKENWQENKRQTLSSDGDVHACVGGDGGGVHAMDSEE